MELKLILQIVGVVLGLLYLWLEYRANIWLWVVGAVMPIVHGTLYLRSGLYADAAMQLYYVAAGIYGLVVWARGKCGEKRREAGLPLAIDHTPRRAILLLLGVGVLLQGAIFFVLKYLTDSTVPFWDSLTTAASIIAMFMLSRKWIEQWGVWFAVDLITAGLYLYKGIPLTGGLYLLYAVLAVVGWRKWAKMLSTF